MHAPRSIIQRKLHRWPTYWSHAHAKAASSRSDGNTARLCRAGQHAIEPAEGSNFFDHHWENWEKSAQCAERQQRFSFMAFFLFFFCLLLFLLSLRALHRQCYLFPYGFVCGACPNKPCLIFSFLLSSLLQFCPSWPLFAFFLLVCGWLHGWPGAMVIMPRCIYGIT